MRGYIDKMRAMIRRSVKAIVSAILRFGKLKNIVLFESVPDFSDNTREVFDEMIRRGWNEKYRFVWYTNSKSTIGDEMAHKNVSVVDKSRKICRYVLSYKAKMMISCNVFLPKRRESQYHLFLTHGAALKNCRGGYSLPNDVNHALSLSGYLGKYDAVNYKCAEDRLLALGYPRNDILLTAKISLRDIFNGMMFSKVIYWLPTYRQHKNGCSHSEIAMPILYNEEVARHVNLVAEENDVLLVVKPHFAQDVTKIKEIQLSHIIFIDDAFLEEKRVTNYQVLANSSALITDYSSVYYDYLLVDRPIGLCWDDFESYKEREGFTVDPHYILSGGEKIYNKEDLCAFIQRIACGKDILQNRRNEIRNLTHLHVDANSTKRVVDYIEKVLETQCK